MIDRPWFWPTIIAGSAAASLVVVGLGWDNPVRSLVVLWFLCTCPGLAVLHPLELPDAVTGLALVVPLSLAIDALVAIALLYAGFWSATLALVIVAVVTFVALGTLSLARKEPS